jgi:stress-induced morphogen
MYDDDPLLLLPIIESTKMKILKKLSAALAPVHMEVENVSFQHQQQEQKKQQEGYTDEMSTDCCETHFNVNVVSEEFEGRSLLKRHRLVYAVLADELQTGGVHALSLVTKTPSEVANNNQEYNFVS